MRSLTSFGLNPVTHGTRGRAVHLAGFSITEAMYAPGMTVAAHEHALPSWTYVASGGFVETFSTHEEECVPGAVLSKPGNATHTNRYGPGGATCLLVEITDTSALQERGVAGLFDGVSRFDRGTVPGLARRVLRTLWADTSREPLHLESALLEIASSMMNPGARRVRVARERAWLRATRDRLTDEFRNPPTVTQLSLCAGVHRVHLCQAFRIAFGCTPGEYVRQLRVEYARRLLTSTDESLSLVAASAGYSDQAHFSRQFRAAVGLTPGRFRARYGPRSG